MNVESPLKDKIILVVDDEPDVLDTVEEELDMCMIHKATDYDTALQHLLSYTYDAVVLDIMGVNGFELLKTSVSGFPNTYAYCPCHNTRGLKEIHKDWCRILPSKRENV